ncbi:MAG: hypothetical protein ACRDLV_16120 [Solirubrobacteraceae bacterium]
MLSQSDRVRVLAVTALLTSSATAASRAVALQIEDQNGLLIWTADLEAVQAASLACTYSWARGSGVSAAAAPITGARLSAGLPFLDLEPGDSLSVHTANIDAADQWSAVVVRYQAGEQWEHLQLLERLQAALGG